MVHPFVPRRCELIAVAMKKTPKKRNSSTKSGDSVEKSASKPINETVVSKQSLKKRGKRKRSERAVPLKGNFDEPGSQSKKTRRVLCPFELDGFRVLPWKISEDSENYFQLLYKEHKVRNTVPEKPLGKTLFLSEIPPCLDEAALRLIFSRFGEIADVFAQNRPSSGAPVRATSDFYPIAENSPFDGYRVAYVVFQEAEAVKKALEETYTSPEILKRDGQDEGCSFGLSRFVKMYNKSIPDEEEVLEEATKFLHSYEAEENVRIEEEKREAEPDESGWVTVGSRGTKRGGFSRSEAMERKIDEKEKRKKPRKELVNFYTFQVRESKMKNIEELQKRFEQDKRRLELMKQNRKFKPY